MRRLAAMMLAAVLLLAATGCGDDGVAPERDVVHGTVLVLAAASLTDAFTDLGLAFEVANPDVDLQLNFAGSSALREQILEGAPADIFASANRSNMNQVLAAGDVDAEPQIFARNRLQIAVPAGNPGQVVGLADFADADLLIGLCAVGVPCGEFAREALANAGVEPSIDTNEPDVRALLTKIGADELDAGIVYVTDVASAGDLVEGIDLSVEENVVGDYLVAQLAGAPNSDGAAAFVEFVLSEEGQAILAGHRFAAP